MRFSFRRGGIKAFRLVDGVKRMHVDRLLQKLQRNSARHARTRADESGDGGAECWEGWPTGRTYLESGIDKGAGAAALAADASDALAKRVCLCAPHASVRINHPKSKNKKKSQIRNNNSNQRQQPTPAYEAVPPPNGSSEPTARPRAPVPYGRSHCTSPVKPCTHTR